MGPLCSGSMFYANLAELPRRLARLSRCPKNAERVQSRGGTRTSARVRRPELVPRLHMYRSRSPDRIAARCHSPRLRHNAAVKLGDHQFRCRRRHPSAQCWFWLCQLVLQAVRGTCDDRNCDRPVILGATDLTTGWKSNRRAKETTHAPLDLR